MEESSGDIGQPLAVNTSPKTQTKELVAVYRLGKLVSKYIICYIVGFAGPRKEVGELLMGASHMHRTLLQREFLTFLGNTEPDIQPLGWIKIEHKGGNKRIPNLFCPAAFDWPLEVIYSDLKDNE